MSEMEIFVSLIVSLLLKVIKVYVVNRILEWKIRVEWSLGVVGSIALHIDFLNLKVIYNIMQNVSIYLFSWS